jgi:hypothetical protein
MIIKQNLQIALAFIKKMCRLSRNNTDKLKDLLEIIGQIENGTKSKGVKEQIMKIYTTIKDQSNQ